MSEITKEEWEAERRRERQQAIDKINAELLNHLQEVAKLFKSMGERLMGELNVIETSKQIGEAAALDAHVADVKRLSARMHRLMQAGEL